MTGNDNSAIRLNYEQEYDLLSVWLGGPRLAEDVEVEPGVCVRVLDDQVIGVEIVDAAARLHQDPATLENPGYARSLLDRYARALSDLGGFTRAVR